ncbi:DNA-binding protein [Streptomyces avermitilis]|uniref:DNA-binding protein n=1 Tax=Streptomyces avermitilis (strain ATCC 31267 / DSM 46492 / JCM 5070 / NBRC 14893 / NCIMB 12804 / NRRL 8165 / MA-4680) TaxID=227882 RepID=Q82E72_STRAW|nr:helix-turn-helix transcriptional regulator [Streptomyces sp. SID5469]KUN52445.1 DNA-binding protein [Streptomyces avermitilis]BAC72456.1 putative DNA-binding protein [Streptomyces avermitilis MA-4680 = NBRC 14893]
MSSLWNTVRDAGEGENVAGDEFAGLLKELKERSGLSYGTLGKRLHMSASTLHRYVNGEAVPADYAPVERFARVCRATPEELVELHRRWVRADALRGQKGAPEPAVASAVAVPEPEVEAASGTEGAPEPDAASGAEDAPEVESDAGAEPESPVRRRRTVVLAGAAVAAAVVAAALVVNLVPGKGDDHGRKQSAGAAASSAGVTSDGTASAGAKSASPSPSPSASRGAGPAPSGSRSVGAERTRGPDDGAAAPIVVANAYKWDSPCSQHYLVDRDAARMPPPPTEPDARGWVTALGGVPAGQQMLALTVQGTGKATVVLESLHVRVAKKDAPLAWNDYEMGVGCGGGVETRSFEVDLDAGRPVAVPKAGQRDFPYKVSESDPEVFYVFADARTHDVSWNLELEWSSGTKHGTVRVDDNGELFRTSGNVGRPAYNYPLGSTEWGRNAYEPNVKG